MRVPPMPVGRYTVGGPARRAVGRIVEGDIDRTVRLRKIARWSHVDARSVKCGDRVVVVDGSRLDDEMMFNRSDYEPHTIAEIKDASRILAVTADAGRAIVERDGVVSDGALELNVLYWGAPGTYGRHWVGPHASMRHLGAADPDARVCTWTDVGVGTLVGPPDVLTKRGSTIVGAAYAANGVVVVLSEMDAGRVAIYVVESFVKGHSTRVWKSPPGYADASLSHDGRHVVAVTVAEPPVAVVWTVGTAEERRFELDPPSTVRGARVAGDTVFVYDQLGVRVYGPAWPNLDVVRDTYRRRVVPSPDGTRFVELIFDEEFYEDGRDRYTFCRVHRPHRVASYLGLKEEEYETHVVAEFSPDNETFAVLTELGVCTVYAFGAERLVAAMRDSAAGRSVPAEVLVSIEAFADSAPQDSRLGDDDPLEYEGDGNDMPAYDDPPAYDYPPAYDEDPPAYDYPPAPDEDPPAPERPEPEERIGRRGAVSDLVRHFSNLGRPRADAPVARLAMGPEPEDETDG